LQGPRNITGVGWKY